MEIFPVFEDVNSTMATMAEGSISTGICLDGLFDSFSKETLLDDEV